ncbi:hypothetical protein KR96_24725 [Ralstonia solanacearum]|nr:hypothetical protein KR96_24725 [Ralstonia solanacearum]
MQMLLELPHLLFCKQSHLRTIFQCLAGYAICGQALLLCTPLTYVFRHSIAQLRSLVHRLDSVHHRLQSKKAAEQRTGMS